MSSKLFGTLVATAIAGALSADPEKARLSGEDLLLRPDRIYDDFARMARRESRLKDGIDAVAIVTPNHAHAPAARAFRASGRSAPTWWWPAAQSWRRFSTSGRRPSLASPIAGSAKASCAR